MKFFGLAIGWTLWFLGAFLTLLGIVIDEAGAFLRRFADYCAGEHLSL